MRGGLMIVLATLFAMVLSAAGTAVAQIPVKDDPLVRMPGSQPSPENGVVLEAPNRCLNCHAGYNEAVEPGFNWQGSMMAQASRDFVFWACMTVAGQDSVWAIGSPNALDLCARCHFPGGWLEGRSDPPNASAMTGADYDGVHCDHCHRAYDPFFDTTFPGLREGDDWLGYWDETNASGSPSNFAAAETYAEDEGLAALISFFAGGTRSVPFFADNRPPPNYTENASGQYFISSDKAKRASFADTSARHEVNYSRYHKSKFFCSTCHDVSNPVLANLGANPAEPLPTELNSAHSYYHVERTFSEFMLSDYGQPGGAEGIGPFAPSSFETSLPGNRIGRCQDCHMRDGVGAGCDKSGALIRPNQSIEHPQSGMPIHDLTGGNAWVPRVLASTVMGSANYDPINASLLRQGPAVLTLDLDQGQGLEPTALLAAADRAEQQLRLAASIQNLTYDSSSGVLSFRLQNQTGHKLISGFPEGRRMFLQIRAYAGNTLIWEANPYDPAASTLKGLSYNYQPDPTGTIPAPQALDPGREELIDELIYETHPSSSLTGEDETFHFVLATDRYKDNRIPPKGFRIDEALGRLAQPRWKGADAMGYFTPAEYAGGYDQVSRTIPPGADYVEVELYYQTISREYAEFLRDEIEGNPNNQTLPASAYQLQTDPFFAGLRAWGDTFWRLWIHNRALQSAAPVLMTQASIGTPPTGCMAPKPTLLTATPSSGQVALSWSDEHSSDPTVAGYRVYYDQAGKAQLLVDAGLSTSFTDSGLTNGLQYCYTVTSYTPLCESEFSNSLCATPNASGQLQAGVTVLETGIWVSTGEGMQEAEQFVPTTSFARGDEVLLRAQVVDVATGLPLAGARVRLSIQGPEMLILTTRPSSEQGVAEASWQTTIKKTDAVPTGDRGEKKAGGTKPGVYTVTVTGVIASGYGWNNVQTATAFSLQ